jgi:hypothetical protein
MGPGSRAGPGATVIFVTRCGPPLANFNPNGQGEHRNTYQNRSSKSIHIYNLPHFNFELRSPHNPTSGEHLASDLNSSHAGTIATRGRIKLKKP